MAMPTSAMHQGEVASSRNRSSWPHSRSQPAICRAFGQTTQPMLTQQLRLGRATHDRVGGHGAAGGHRRDADAGKGAGTAE